MDAIDRQLLAMLQRDSRLSYGDLGARVGLSVSAVNERLKKLAARGALRAFVAVVDPRALGFRLCGFVQVLVDRPEHEAAFLARVAQTPEIQECHHVTGDYSYLLKVRVRDTAHLEALLADTLKSLPGVTRTQTVVVLSTPKETTEVPVWDGEPGAPDASR